MTEGIEARLEQYRGLLLARRERLLGEAATGGESAATVELDQTRVGRLSRMDALQSQALSVETNRLRAVELQQIAAALRRLDAGDYGYCVACGEPINPARLDIDPAAAKCVECAGRGEQAR